MPMPSNITITRYQHQDGENPVPWSGYIEGTDNDGEQWITYLDEHGRPALHWARREPDGAVIGDPVELLAA